MENMKNTETAAFCRQMALILHAGISGVEGISIMLEDAASEEEKKLLSDIYEAYMSSGSMHDALAHTGVFPEYMLQMVQIGEMAGRLDDVMDSLADYYEREHRLYMSIRNAVIYPLMMIVMMFVVILVLITRVLPVFNSVFLQLGSEMTGISKTLLSLGSVINRYAVAAVLLLILLAAVGLFFFRSAKGHLALSHLAASFKGTRKISEKMAACRFATGMSLMLTSGLTPEESLETSAQLVKQYPAFAKKLEAVRLASEEGNDILEAFNTCRVFTGVDARLVTIGQKTGSVDDIMKKIADRYEDEIDDSLGAAIAVLEPTLVIILSVVSGLILLSVMLPLLGILSGL